MMTRTLRTPTIEEIKNMTPVQIEQWKLIAILGIWFELAELKRK